MKKFAAGISTAALIALGTAGAAVADGHIAMSPMDKAMACNTAYQACLSGGTDMMMASSPAEGMSKMQMNMQTSMMCGQQLMQCYTGM